MVAVVLPRVLKALVPYRRFVLTTPDAPDLIRWRVETQKALPRNLVGLADVRGFKIRRDGWAMKWPPPVAVGEIVVSTSGRTEVRVVLRPHWSFIIFCGICLMIPSMVFIGSLVAAVLGNQILSTLLVAPAMIAVVWLMALAQFRSEAGWLKDVVRWCVLCEYAVGLPNPATRPPSTPVT